MWRSPASSPDKTSSKKAWAIWFRSPWPWHSPAASCWFWRRSASSASSGSWWPREHANSPSGWRSGSTRLRVFGLMLSDIVKLVIPGVAGGLLLAAVLIRTMEDVMGTPLTLGPTPLGVMEPLIYVVASAIAVSVALLAGLPAARRATSVQPMVAIRSE